jgi:hypothetical protein
MVEDGGGNPVVRQVKAELDIGSGSRRGSMARTREGSVYRGLAATAAA